MTDCPAYSERSFWRSRCSSPHRVSGPRASGPSSPPASSPGRTRSSKASTSARAATSRAARSRPPGASSATSPSPSASSEERRPPRRHGQGVREPATSSTRASTATSCHFDSEGLRPQARDRLRARRPPRPGRVQGVPQDALVPRPLRGVRVLSQGRPQRRPRRDLPDLSPDEPRLQGNPQGLRPHEDEVPADRRAREDALREAATRRRASTASRAFRPATIATRTPTSRRSGSARPATSRRASRSSPAGQKFDHSKTRYPLLGRHASVPCQTCHVKPATLVHLKYARCADCHRDPHKPLFATEDCAACHTEVGLQAREVRPRDANEVRARRQARDHAVR